MNAVSRPTTTASESELLRDILEWDVRSWSIILTHWDKKVDWEKIGLCLELGARQGGLSLWLGLKGKAVVCSDYEKVGVIAEPLHKKYNVRAKMTYKEVNAMNIPFENEFDLVAFRSVIGAIGEGDLGRQQLVFDQIYKALKPGGILLFAENLDASPVHRLFRKFTRWSGYWRYPSLEELTTFMHQFSSCQTETTGVLGVFGRNEKQKCWLAGLDRLILNKFAQKSWRYIAYGIAVK